MASRSRKRQDLLEATERLLDAVATRLHHKRRPLHGAARIGLAVGAVLNKHKMAKHFDVAISDTTPSPPKPRRQPAFPTDIGRARHLGVWPSLNHVSGPPPRRNAPLPGGEDRQCVSGRDAGADRRGARATGGPRRVRPRGGMSDDSIILAAIASLGADLRGEIVKSRSETS
jgi:hypothetical protein